MMATAVYLLCALTSAMSAFLLLSMYWRHRLRTTGLVFWSGLSFACFAISNTLVLADLVVLPRANLAIARAATACLAAGLMLFGLITHTD